MDVIVKHSIKIFECLFIFHCKEIDRKNTDPCNAKEYYQSFIRKKNRKSVKQPEIFTDQPKVFDTVDIKSVITEHPKTSHKLSKTTRQSAKGGSNITFYSDTKKREYFLNEKNVKIAKREHILKAMQVLITLKF